MAQNENRSGSVPGDSASNEHVGKVHTDGASNASLLLNWWVCLLVLAIAITFGYTFYQIRELNNKVSTLDGKMPVAVDIDDLEKRVLNLKEGMDKAVIGIESLDKSFSTLQGPLADIRNLQSSVSTLWNHMTSEVTRITNLIMEESNRIGELQIFAKQTRKDLSTWILQNRYHKLAPGCLWAMIYDFDFVKSMIKDDGTDKLSWEDLKAHLLKIKKRVNLYFLYKDFADEDIETMKKCFGLSEENFIKKSDTTYTDLKLRLYDYVACWGTSFDNCVRIDVEGQSDNEIGQEDVAKIEELVESNGCIE